jgi:hypothetical protein
LHGGTALRVFHGLNDPAFDKTTFEWIKDYYRKAYAFPGRRTLNFTPQLAIL